VDTLIRVTVDGTHALATLPWVVGLGACWLIVVALLMVRVYVETTPALPVRVRVCVSLATTSLAVNVLVMTLVSDPDPTVTYTVDTLGGAVVSAVCTAAAVEMVEVRTWSPRVTVRIVSTGICEVTVLYMVETTLDTTCEAGALGEGATMEVCTLVDATTVLLSWAIPETVTVTTLGTCTTVVLKTVVWTVCCLGVTWAGVSAAGHSGSGVGVTGTTLVMVEVAWKELVDVLSKPSLSEIVMTETTGETDTTTAVEEDPATAATEEEEGGFWTLVAPGTKKEAEPPTARASVCCRDIYIVSGAFLFGGGGLKVPILPVVVTTAELRLAPTLDDMAEASDTGQTVVVSATILVTITG
jgi:hypothetical protein